MRRRDILKTLAIMSASANAQPDRKPLRFYVGTYSSPGNGEGIYCFDMDPATGALSNRRVNRVGTNPGCLAIDQARMHLYAANEIEKGSVSAYRIDAETGDLSLLNTVSSEDAGPTHISIHPAGKHLLVANYFGGSSTVLPILGDGKLAPASDNQKHRGKLGPTHAASGPPGSFAISGHDAPHAHMIHSDPTGKYVLATDLGLDLIFVWKFDVQNGKLQPNSEASVPPGDGPRHFVFHPNQRWMYCIQEEASTMAVFEWDASAGRLTAKQTLSTLPKGFAGTDFTSGIDISADGRFVYGANRLHNTIAWFAVGANGQLTLQGEEWVRGDYPRSFTIDPTGNYLYSCNQRSDALTAFHIDKPSGALKFTGQYTAVGSPSSALFA
jgi:6-phosphogluconolactonase (cycloisomerase 2 family)